MMPTAIRNSDDLADLLNTSSPATEADAAETPRDWIAGLWVAGQTYPLDPQATTDTLAVLADGTAAVAWSPKGEWCTGKHRTGVESQAGHWCPADTDSWTWGSDVRGVTRDWCTVNVWDANGFSETETYPSLAAAKEAFAGEVKDLRENSAPQIDAGDLRKLLAGTSETPVLYVTEADGGQYTLDVWDSAYVSRRNVVVTRAELIDWVGENPDGEALAELLPDLQEKVDEVTQQQP